jgi:hypothetical protein
MKKILILLLFIAITVSLGSNADVSAGSVKGDFKWAEMSKKVTDEYINDYSSLLSSNSEFFVNYYDRTKHSEVIDAAARNWNDTNLVHINETKTDFSLFIIEEDQGKNGALSSYTVKDELRYITINSYYFDSLTWEEKIYVITHELGHSIGLVDIESGSSSVMMKHFNVEQSKVSVLDQLMLVNLLSLEGNNFGEEFYESVSYMCELSELSHDGSTIEIYNICDGGTGGGSSTTPTIAEQVADFTDSIQEIIDTISDGDVNAGYIAFMTLFPESLVLDLPGATAKGVYASFGGLWLGGSNILPIGGTVGLQFVLDSYGNLAIQYFIGAGIHIIPHADVIAFAMYYVETVHYTDFEGLSATISASLLTVGAAGEYIFNGGIYGFGLSVSIFSLDLGIDIQLSAEVQYTDTLYVGPAIN